MAQSFGLATNIDLTVRGGCLIRETVDTADRHLSQLRPLLRTLPKKQASNQHHRLVKLAQSTSHNTTAQQRMSKVELIDHDQGCAGLCVWECRIHGPLPVTRFSKEDLSRKRHRCKRCLADKMAKYRLRLPLRHMWNCFLQRARKHFDVDSVNGLHWIEHGQPLISKLLCGTAFDARTLHCYKLTWLPGDELDLQL